MAENETCPKCNTTYFPGPHTELDCLRYQNADLEGRNGALQSLLAEANARINKLEEENKKLREACENALDTCKINLELWQSKMWNGVQRVYLESTIPELRAALAPEAATPERASQ